MDDLISREAMLEALGHFNDYVNGDPHFLNGIETAKEITEKLPAVDAVPVVRCAYCKHCYDMGSDPMEPYDGESEWYCERFDRDTSAYEIDPYRFFCADGERRLSRDATDTVKRPAGRGTGWGREGNGDQSDLRSTDI